MRRFLYTTAFVTVLAAAAWSAPEVWVESLDLKGFVQGRGVAQARHSLDGKPLSIGGRVYAHGVGTNADSQVSIDLGHAATRFQAQVGIDDAVGHEGSVVFRVEVDGVERYNSGQMRGGDPARTVDVDLREAARLRLLVDNSGAEIYRDEADWALARIETTGTPRTIVLAPVKAERRTPPGSPRPRIAGPRAASELPGKPFLFTIRATGKGPFRFGSSPLPAGLQLDPATGIISGSVTSAGRWTVKVRASSPAGTAERDLRIVIGPDLQLTPALGWNSWNAWGASVDDAKIRAAADRLVSSGLASHGWTYINIDDGWAGGRDAQGNILPNSKFPDMRALGQYVHARGLKFGIYSSPGPKTCAGFVGSDGHEAQDARTYADWGVDYLKYDWCSCTNPSSQAPYKIMHDALASQARDIVFSLCQYGRDQVWTWGAQWGNSWRTTGDIDDGWGSVLGIGFAQNGLQPYAVPGHFNDPDMLVVGWLGWGPQVRPTHLNPNEQYAHVSLWALLAAPLFIGCDLDRLDDFTLGLLSNDEVLDIDQDPAARQGWRLVEQGNAQVWGRPLSDGSWAIGFFNMGMTTPQRISFDVRKLGLLGRVRVRDVWRQADLPMTTGLVQANVAPHGAELMRVTLAP